MAAEHEGRKACPEITGQDKCVEPYGIATQLLVEYLVILVLLIEKHTCQSCY